MGSRQQNKPVNQFQSKPQEIFTKESHRSFKKTNTINRLFEIYLKESCKFKGTENFKVLESLPGSGRKRKIE